MIYPRLPHDSRRDILGEFLLSVFLGYEGYLMRILDLGTVFGDFDSFSKIPVCFFF